MADTQRSDLARLYREPYDFTQSVHNDMIAFFNLKEFAAIHDVDGVKVTGILTGNVHDRYLSAPDHEGVFRSSVVFYARRPDLREVRPGTTTRIDGKVYTVTSCRLIQGEVWRIELGVYDG